MITKCLFWKTKTMRPSDTAHQQMGCYLAEHWVRNISQWAQWKRWEVTKDQHCLLPNRVRDQPSLQDGVISLLQPTHTCSQDQRVSHPHLFPHIHINQSSGRVDAILVFSNPPPPLPFNNGLLLSCKMTKANLAIHSCQTSLLNLENLQCLEAVSSCIFSSTSSSHLSSMSRVSKSQTEGHHTYKEFWASRS